MQKLSVSDLFSWSSAPIDFPEGIAADAALSLIEVSLSAAPIPVLMTHTQFASDGPVISYANPAFCLSTGYFLHELINAPISKLRGPKSDRRVQKQLVSDVLSSGSFEGEDVNYRKDGSKYTVRWSVVPIRDAAGQTVRCESSKALDEGRDFVAVVIDLYKPEVQGAGLMKDWHFRVTKVPTVILAGHLPEDFDTVLGDDSRVAILAKPYLPSDLLDAIASVRQG